MERFKRVGILIIGWVFVGVGVLGLFLPILQGILFIMIGLALLSSRSETVRRWLKDLEERHPHYHERMERWRKRMRDWFKRDGKKKNG